ncbi:hypothetical protein DXD43_08570 [Bifidobacterium pseudocatenulatum]|nr:hypothetical protein DXD43_08570 [Bifidobacterium pseudocatenulatum]
MLFIYLDMTIYRISKSAEILDFFVIRIWHQVVKGVFGLRSLATSRGTAYVLKQIVSKPRRINGRIVKALIFFQIWSIHDEFC